MSFSNIVFRRIGHRAIAAPLKFLCSTTPSLHKNYQNFSSLVTKEPHFDQSLVRVLELEIKCFLETDDHTRVHEIPKDFPFKIEDNLGQRSVILKREYNGEAIKVEVHMPSLVTGNEDDDDDDSESEKAAQPNIPLVVSVSKDNGPCLEFGVTAFPDEVSIDSMSVRASDASEDQIPYEGPDFTSLDENLQKAFHKYLELRGIRPIATNFLYEYMINKDIKEYILWLKNLKKFIEK